MPWKIVPADYNPIDRTTLHDDELIAMERALSESTGQPQNEYNPAWRALQKVKPLATQCTGDGDPLHVLPPGAAGNPRHEEAAPGAPGANPG